MYYDQKGGRALRIVVVSAKTLFAPLSCLPLLKFCFSSFYPVSCYISSFLSFFFLHIFPPHFFPLFFPLWHCSRHWTAFLFLDFAFPLFPSYFLLSCSWFSFLKFLSVNPPFIILVPVKEPQLHFGCFFYLLVRFRSDLSLLVLYCRQLQIWCGGFWLQLSPLALLWFPMRHSTPKPTSLYTIARLLINGIKSSLDLVLCFCAFLFWAVQEIRWSFAFATYILGLLYL